MNLYVIFSTFEMISMKYMFMYDLKSIFYRSVYVCVCVCANNSLTYKII